MREFEVGSIMEFDYDDKHVVCKIVDVILRGIKAGDLFQIKPNLKDFCNEPPRIVCSMVDNAGKIFEVRGISSEGYLELGAFTYRREWVNPIREVERPAKPGEFIKIVNADYNGVEEYENGDILKVIDAKDQVQSDGRAFYKNERLKYADIDEYVVLEGYEDCDQVKKFEKLQIGDIVVVTNPGKNYPNYSDWFDRFAKEYASRYVYGGLVKMGSKHEIVAIHAHGTVTDKILYAIKDEDNGIHLIGEEGLEKC